MDHLVKNEVINESELDQKYYFQSLFLKARTEGLLSETQIERIQLELVNLMAKEVERYTNDESSSIPVEKAHEILQSITYNMGYFLKSTTDMTQKLDILKGEKISALFLKGMESVNACKMRAEYMLKKLQQSSLKIDNIAFRETIFTDLPKFFHDYDIEFGAHEITASFDYPLFEVLTELLGVEYIEEYLKRLTVENGFLKHFSEDTINLLLKGYDKEAEHLLINIFELVCVNALGCAMLGKNIDNLEIREEELPWLQERLEALDKKGLQIRLEEALQDMNKALNLEPEVSFYIKAALPVITDRLSHNLATHTLDKIFNSYQKNTEDVQFYEDGIPMEDEKLRSLIEEMRECLDTSDKIDLMKMHVSSMADFTELIEECFYEVEYEELFMSLTQNERMTLQKVLQLEAGMEYDSQYEPEKLWQKKFLQFGNTKN